VSPEQAGQQDMETTVLDCMETVLGERLGLDEDFIEAGGNSFHAALLLARLRSRTATSVRLPDFLTYPTARYLADRIRASKPATEHE
jgi:Phosphopantetheine attachment site